MVEKIKADDDNKRKQVKRQKDGVGMGKKGIKTGEEGV